MNLMALNCLLLQGDYKENNQDVLMSKNKIVSIIIVNYKVKELLLKCIKSIVDSKNKTSYEIIVVDNDERKTIRSDLKVVFPEVKYIPNENKGFGQGNNAGVSASAGRYLFFLNPDTELSEGSLDILSDFLKRNNKAGIVSPIIFYPNKKPHLLQGSEILTPFKSLFVYSFINKFFPSNPISRKFWNKDWNKKTLTEVDVVPGTALMIRRDLFKKVGKFDESYFLYFEEYDLCKRVRELGYKAYIVPKAIVVHKWGASTSKRDDIKEIFSRSRFYYFKKKLWYTKSCIGRVISKN